MYYCTDGGAKTIGTNGIGGTRRSRAIEAKEKEAVQRLPHLRKSQQLVSG